MSESGSIPFPHGNERLPVACALAGVLAEHAVQDLVMSDPRFCQSTRLSARHSDLPRVLSEAADGVTLHGDGIALLIDAQHIRFVASAPIARSLAQINPLTPTAEDPRP